MCYLNSPQVILKSSHVLPELSCSLIPIKSLQEILNSSVHRCHIFFLLALPELSCSLTPAQFSTWITWTRRFTNTTSSDNLIEFSQFTGSNIPPQVDWLNLDLCYSLSSPAGCFLSSSCKALPLTKTVFKMVLALAYHLSYSPPNSIEPM